MRTTRPRRVGPNHSVSSSPSAPCRAQSCRSSSGSSGRGSWDASARSSGRRSPWKASPSSSRRSSLATRETASRRGSTCWPMSDRGGRCGLGVVRGDGQRLDEPARPVPPRRLRKGDRPRPWAAMLNAATPGQTTHKGLAAFMAAASAVAGLVSLGCLAAAIGGRARGRSERCHRRPVRLAGGAVLLSAGGMLTMRKAAGASVTVRDVLLLRGIGASSLSLRWSRSSPWCSATPPPTERRNVAQSGGCGSPTATFLVPQRSSRFVAQNFSRDSG